MPAEFPFSLSVPQTPASLPVRAFYALKSGDAEHVADVARSLAADGNEDGARLLLEEALRITEARAQARNALFPATGYDSHAHPGFAL
jgi:hypothetical protein